MDDDNSFSKKLKNYYKEKKKKIEEFIETDNKYRYAFSKNLFRVVDIRTDKIYLEGEYQTVGVYNKHINMFYRSNITPFINKSEFNKLDSLIDKKILELNSYLNKKKISSFEFEKNIFYLKNNNFYCSKENLKEFIYLVSSLGEFVFEIPKNNFEINLILLLDIKKV